MRGKGGEGKELREQEREGSEEGRLPPLKFKSG